MEREEDSKLPFPDVLDKRRLDGVYREPTHAHLYLHDSSHHHPPQKRAVLSIFVPRANTTSNRKV
jgi:hypothetical protein